MEINQSIGGIVSADKSGDRFPHKSEPAVCVRYHILRRVRIVKFEMMQYPASNLSNDNQSQSTLETGSFFADSNLFPVHFRKNPVENQHIGLKTI